MKMATSPGSSSETTKTPSDTSHRVSSSSAARRARKRPRPDTSFRYQADVTCSLGREPHAAQVQEPVRVLRHPLHAFAQPARRRAVIGNDRWYFFGERLLEYRHQCLTLLWINRCIQLV